ncbi:hypothetical protein Taro_017721 [Colocasia esculenta]|uniref:Alginate lyase 2 domain-containing protein n=1 Tax=Colocasia esculenta TaxID=4460 RepID=A0A843UWY4_COLES|nr:hypothetical protein [Colocasia esculenta]
MAASRLVLLFAVVALQLAPAHMPTCAADPTDGFTSVPLTEANFVIQKPYNMPLDQRYSFVNGVRRLWVFDDDEPFQAGNPTLPRTEIRFTGYDYSSGVWQFEGYGYVPEGTTGTSIVQIHRDTNGATEMMLRVYNGELRNYRTAVVATNVYDRWMRINVIHNADTGEVRVFIDGVQGLQVVSDKGPATFYFKCGVYTQNDSSHCMESRWRDIKLYMK